MADDRAVTAPRAATRAETAQNDHLAALDLAAR